MDAENLNLQTLGRQSRCGQRISPKNFTKFGKALPKRKSRIDLLEVEKYRNTNYKNSLSLSELSNACKSAGYIQVEFDDFCEQEEYFFNELVMNLNHIIQNN